MTVTDVRTDRETRTLTLTADFAASAQQVWRLWEDPRMLERWWGPPTFPATVQEHDLTPGGRVTYVMTGPEGDQARGWWRIIAAEPPAVLEFEDGFADADGNPDPALPITTVRVTVQPDGAGATRMVVQTSFPTAEAMDQLTATGMVEGMTEAMGQIDALLAEQTATT